MLLCRTWTIINYLSYHRQNLASSLHLCTRERIIILSRGHDSFSPSSPFRFFANFTQSCLHVGRANTRRLFRQENNGMRVEKGGQSISILVDRAIVLISRYPLVSTLFISTLLLLLLLLLSSSWSSLRFHFLFFYSFEEIKVRQELRPVEILSPPRHNIYIHIYIYICII